MPSKLKVLQFKLKNQQLGADIFGAYKSAFHGTGMEFAEHREYVPGDEIKHIDWKVSARTNKVYVKRYDEERNLNVLFLIDINYTLLQFPKKKQLLEETFFILAMSAINNNDNIAVLLNNRFFQQTKSLYIVPRIINEIESLNDLDGLSSFFDEKLEKIKYIKNHLIFILTDKATPDIKQLKKIELNNNEIIYINIFDVFENNLDTFGNFLDIKDGKDIISVDLENRQKIEKYRSLRYFKLTTLKEELTKNKIGYVLLQTGMDPFKELFRFFLTRNYK